MERSQAWTTSRASCSISEPIKPVPGWKNGKKFARGGTYDMNMRFQMQGGKNWIFLK
jgi:hypothetical protein